MRVHISKNQDNDGRKRIVMARNYACVRDDGSKKNGPQRLGKSPTPTQSLLFTFGWTARTELAKLTRMCICSST